MFDHKPTQIKTPWIQVNELLNGDGFNPVGLWLLPVINHEQVYDFYAHLIASQAHLLDVSEHPRRNDDLKYTICYMDAGALCVDAMVANAQYAGAMDANVAQYISEHAGKSVGEFPVDHINFNEEAFGERGIRFVNWRLSRSNSLDVAIRGIGDGMLNSGCDMRICIVDRVGLEDYHTETVNRMLRDIRHWAVQNQVLVLMSAPIDHRYFRYETELDKPFIDRFDDKRMDKLYLHKGMPLQADGELLIGHNDSEQELVIRRGKSRNDSRPYGEEVRFDSLVGEFPEWDVK